MYISSDTDSDDCQLYSKAAENVAKKRKVIDARVKEYAEVINLAGPEDSGNISLSILDDVDLTGSKSNTFGRPGSSTSEKLSSSDDDSEDSLSLSELLLRYQNERRGKNRLLNASSVQNSKSRKSKKKPRPTRPKKRQSRRSQVQSNARVLATVVLDDDSGYTVSNLAPIDFSSRRKVKSLNLNSSNISFSSVVTIDSVVDEPIESEGGTTVTVEWKGRERTTRKVFELRRYQKFETVYEELARLENIRTSQVLLMRKFNTIRPQDTPSSLNLKHYAALTGHIAKVDVDYDKFVGISGEDTEDKPNSNMLIVKLQLETHTFSLSIMKHQKMSVLYEKCCEELKCSESNLKITFDGETVDPSESVTDLDLEGGEIFHVYLKK